jgi:hypothetical protein
MQRVSYSQTGARTRVMCWQVQLIFAFKSVSEGTGRITAGETMHMVKVWQSVNLVAVVKKWSAGGSCEWWVLWCRKE